MKKQRQLMRRYAVLGVAALTVLSLGLMAAASDQNNQGNGQQYYGQGGGQSNQGNQGGQQAQTRNLQLERQIAGALRQAGYGAQGEIMILATGDQVTLLGTVPSEDQKNGAEQIAKGVARGLSVDNRLHVGAQARQINDNQLQNKINDQLSDDLKRDVHVSVQNGTATLQGHVNNWNQVADAIDAAFSAGANRVNSQFTVGAGAATARGGGAPPSYGYAPGQQGFAGQQGYAQGQQGYAQGQPGAMGRAGQASASDLRLAQQVAGHLRQQLPPGQNVQLIQPQSIYVSASQGTVTLHGYVQNNNEKQQAQQIARSIRGVRNVRNDLTILSPAAAGGQMGGGQQGSGGQNQYGQSGSYPPQGYIPGQNSQTGSSGQSQYGQSSQMGGAQQGFGGQNQSEYGQGGQQGFGDQGQHGQGDQMGGGQAGMTRSDVALAQQVAQQLKQKLTGIQNVQVMRPGTIYVIAANGNVLLQGFVTNPNIKQQVSQIAKAVPGVRNVTDQLQVIGRSAGAYPSYGYVPGQEGQAGGGQQGAAGQSSSPQPQFIAEQRNETEPGEQSQMGTSLSDMALAHQATQRLWQQLTGFENIQIMMPGTIYVKASNGTITLDGFVPDNRTRQQAEQVVKSITGVQNVRNSLSIGPVGTAMGYMPGGEYGNEQFGNEPSENEQFGNEQFGNQQDQGQGNGSNQGGPY